MSLWRIFCANPGPGTHMGRKGDSYEPKSSMTGCNALTIRWWLLKGFHIKALAVNGMLAA